LARRIKSDATISSTRLLMLTSLGQRDDCATLHRAGVARCLAKPVKQSHLFNALAIMMAESDTADAVVPVLPTNAEQAEGVYVAATSGSPTKQIRILVAEDNVVNQRVALVQLQNLGYAAD